MRKSSVLIVFSFIFSSAYAQTKLLVTDFIFFNNFDQPKEVYIPDFFVQDPEKLDLVKKLTIEALQRRYDSLEVSFHDKSTWFVGYIDPSSVDPSELYRDNHKKLVKQGGYDYYLRFYADISVTTQINNAKEYSFSLQVRISDSRGKKAFRNINRAPFTSTFSPAEINDGSLLSKEDFYSFLERGIPRVFESSKVKISPIEVKRPTNPNFKDFTSRAGSYTLEDSGGKTPTLKQAGNTKMELTVSQGFQSEKEPISVLSDNLEVRTNVGIKNTAIENEWKVRVAAKSTKALGIVETGARNADIRIRQGREDFGSFELKNGQLTGEIGGIPYLLSYEENAMLTLVYVNQRLTALMQPNGNSNSKLKVFFEGSDEVLARILNLQHVYDQAIYTLNQARSNN